MEEEPASRGPRPRRLSPTGFARTGFRLLGSRRLLIALLLAAAIPVLLLSGWVAYLTAQQRLEVARRSAATSVTRIAERVAAEVETQVQVVQTLGSSVSLDGPDLSTFYREATRVKALQPLWETVELADPSGFQVLNLLRPLNDHLAPTADRRSFEKAVESRQPVVGGIGPIGPVSGKRLVAIRVPVVRDGTLRFVLSVRLATTAVSEILHNAGAPQGGIGVVVDHDGTVIARTDAEGSVIGRQASASLRAAIARAPQGSYTGRTIDGADVEVIYRTLARTDGWSVHVGLPVDALNAPVMRSYRVIGGGAAFSVVIAFALAGLVSRDIASMRRGQEARMALALRMSEEQGAAAVEAAELGTLRWELDAARISGSERARILLGLRPRDPADPEAGWPASAVLALVVAADRDRLRRALRRCRDGSPLEAEFRIQHDDGAVRWVRMVGRAPILADNAPRVIYGVVADIEPAKQAETERTELRRRFSEARENEQRRIARELHDQVGQTVTGLSLGLQRLGAALDGGRPDNARGQVAWLQALATDIGRDLHRAAVDLRPTALDDLGLREALDAFLNQWEQRHGVGTDMQYLVGGERLPPEVETALYRIAQEVLTNVAKHASATAVSLIVERHSDEVRIVVEDDGIGFDPCDSAGWRRDGRGEDGKPKLGLSGIRERLALLGGSLSIESEKGVGTTLFVGIPLPGDRDLASENRAVS